VSNARRHALRRTLIRRLARNTALVSVLVLAALGLGATGYHLLDGLPWLDAALNAAMILTGMGPVSPVSTRPAKIFAIGYALFSGVFFLTMVAVLMAPALRHFLHRFHLELSEEADRNRPRDASIGQPTAKWAGGRQARSADPPFGDRTQ
jgi:hypothetical protein